MVDLSLKFKPKKYIILDPLQELKLVPAKAKISPNNQKINWPCWPILWAVAPNKPNFTNQKSVNGMCIIGCEVVCIVMWCMIVC